MLIAKLLLRLSRFFNRVYSIAQMSSTIGVNNISYNKGEGRLGLGTVVSSILGCKWQSCVPEMNDSWTFAKTRMG